MNQGARPDGRATGEGAEGGVAETVAEGLALIVGYGLDRDAEGAQLVLIALEHSHEGGVRFLLDRVGGDVASEFVEWRGVAADQESGKEIDPPLELWGK